MPEKKNSSEERVAEKKPSAIESEAPRKRRRHGYRGYPMSKGDSGVHWGRGFAGTEPLGGGVGVTPPKAGVFTEESTKRTPKAEEED